MANENLKYIYFDEVELEILIKCLDVVREYSDTPNFILDYIDVIIEKLEVMRDNQ